MSIDRIYLVGYMGAGKSCIGRLLAKKIGWQFIDLDLFIENRHRKSVQQIFSEYGEKIFRELEHKALLEISSFEKTVIATGGGVPCFYSNMDFMNQSGITIYLKTSVRELTNRLKISKLSRPLIKNKTDEELASFIGENLQLRETFYNEAHIIFDAEDLFTQTDLETITTRLADDLKSNIQS